MQLKYLLYMYAYMHIERFQGKWERQTEACDRHCHELSDFVEGLGIVNEMRITQSMLHCV